MVTLPFLGVLSLRSPLSRGKAQAQTPTPIALIDTFDDKKILYLKDPKNYGNSGIFLSRCNAGFRSSAVRALPPKASKGRTERLKACRKGRVSRNGPSKADSTGVPGLVPGFQDRDRALVQGCFQCFKVPSLRVFLIQSRFRGLETSATQWPRRFIWTPRSLSPEPENALNPKPEPWAFVIPCAGQHAQV